MGDESDCQLGPDDEDDPKTPLIVETFDKDVSGSHGDTLFKFPPKSILKSSKPPPLPKLSLALPHLLSVPLASPQVSPILPMTSTFMVSESCDQKNQPTTPLLQTDPPGGKVSFLQHEVTCLEASSRSNNPVPQFETTKYKRTQYLSHLLLILTEGILPLFSIVSSLYNAMELFLQGETSLGWVALGLFCFPTILVLFFYTENMFHREKKTTELGLIIVLGPFLRWLCSVRLLSFKLRGNSSPDFRDIENFAFATKIIDGIIQGSLQIIWLLYLISINIFPLPLISLQTRLVTDWFGNSLELPILSGYTLYSSLAVLVKNLAQLWRTYYPVPRDQTIVPQPQLNRSWRMAYQWCLLVLFATSSVFYRLISYTLLLLHLNLFMMPAGAILVLSAVLHVLLRGVSNKFYVETSKMDVFLTACCCCLVPTPTSSNLRAHNLLQAHTAVTNFFLFLSLGLAIFFNLDYGVPIVRRPNRVVYSSDTFYTYCLVAICLLPISYFFYFLYQKEMQHPDTVSKSIFWRNKSPTPLSIVLTVVSVTLLSGLILLLCLGSYSSSHCDTRQVVIEHGMLVPSISGSTVECHQNYEAKPSGRIFCMWFFGLQGIINIYPLYLNRDMANSVTNTGISYADNFFNTSAHSININQVTFMRNFDDVNCIRKAELKTPTACQHLSSGGCDVNSLRGRQVPHGVWICIGATCALACSPGFSSSNKEPFFCSVRGPEPGHYCHLTALAASNKTHVEVVSGEEDCKKTTTKKVNDPHSMEIFLLCKTPEEMLEPRSCLTLNQYDKTVNFVMSPGGRKSPSASLIKYSSIPRPLSDQLARLGQPLHNGEVSLRGECIVQLDHRTLVIVGEKNLLVGYNGTRVTYLALPPLLVPRFSHTCSLVGGARILVAGGRGLWRGDWLLVTELMDLNKYWKGWTSVGDVHTPRVGGNLLTVDGGCVMLVGGTGESGEDVGLVEEFHSHAQGHGGVWLAQSFAAEMVPTSWSTTFCGEPTPLDCGKVSHLTNKENTVDDQVEGDADISHSTTGSPEEDSRDLSTPYPGLFFTSQNYLGSSSTLHQPLPYISHSTTGSPEEDNRDLLTSNVDFNLETITSVTTELHLSTYVFSLLSSSDETTTPYPGLYFTRRNYLGSSSTLHQSVYVFTLEDIPTTTSTIHIDPTRSPAFHTSQKASDLVEFSTNTDARYDSTSTSVQNQSYQLTKDNGIMITTESSLNIFENLPSTIVQSTKTATSGIVSTTNENYTNSSIQNSFFVSKTSENLTRPSTTKTTNLNPENKVTGKPTSDIYTAASSSEIVEPNSSSQHVFHFTHSIDHTTTSEPISEIHSDTNTGLQTNTVSTSLISPLSSTSTSFLVDKMENQPETDGGIGSADYDFEKESDDQGSGFVFMFPDESDLPLAHEEHLSILEAPTTKQPSFTFNLQTSVYSQESNVDQPTFFFTASPDQESAFVFTHYPDYEYDYSLMT